MSPFVLRWIALPPGATHWALVVEDPDVPLRHAYVHGVAIGRLDGRFRRDWLRARPIAP